MRSRTLLRAVLPSVCLVCLWACGSDSQESTTPAEDAGTDAVEVDAIDTPDAAEDGTLAEDVAADVPVEAGPTSCAEACSASCAAQDPIEGQCASCVETVCAEYSERAEQAPSRDKMFACMDACGTDAGCPNDCCNKYPQACAWEVAFEMCTCGFKEETCATDCTESCTSAGLTQGCGVCASQSPCSMATFDYLFAASRFSHQDCVDTCTSSSLTLEECLGRCRDDFPEAGAAYDAFLACVCP